MIWAEVFLIIIGLVFIGASFYVTERLSQQDLDQISLMSEAELKRIADKQVKEMKNRVETDLEDLFDEALEITERGLERETNNKIMAVSEYSETVLESINNAHNEITFLYSMLNEKQTETAQMVSDLQKITKQIRDMDLESTIAKAETATTNMAMYEKTFEPFVAPVVEIVEEAPVVMEPTTGKEVQEIPEEVPVLSKNEQILQLYREGKDEVEIAKTLDCGLGEVRLVLGLYNNEA